MRTYQTQGLSGLTRACAQVPSATAAHASVVGMSAVRRARPFNHQESVQLTPAQVQGARQLVLEINPDLGISGSVAETTGMVWAARKGGTASGIPPRGRPA
jgi:hypothetical protein